MRVWYWMCVTCTWIPFLFIGCQGCCDVTETEKPVDKCAEVVCQDERPDDCCMQGCDPADGACKCSLREWGKSCDVGNGRGICDGAGTCIVPNGGAPQYPPTCACPAVP
jgi:hypothetical protein